MSKPTKIISHAFTLARLHEAVNARRPDNGFALGRFIAVGWTAQPAYGAR